MRCLTGAPGGAIDPDALAEERRLFYVGLTRAQDAVFVSHAAQRHLYGKALELPPSRFLSALPPSRSGTPALSAMRDDESLRR